MTWAQRRLAAIFLVFASVLAAAGCVSVPTTGPIDKVEEGQQPPCCVNVEVRPPAPGAEPRQIVEGFLRANNNYQPNYLVARQFLTQMAAEKWSPEGGVSIYQGSLQATRDDTVNLSGRLVGSLGKDRTYRAEDRELNQNFGLKKDENGEWRIDTLPSGLWVDEFYFTRFYQTYDLYFVGNGTSLAPEPIYLPALSNPANVASALMKALLRGPSEWFKPAVTSAIPPNTNLSVDSVTITDGIAEVSLSDSVLALPDPQRSLLAAQVVYTLRQVSGVESVLLKVNQQPYRVPGSDPNTLAIPVDAIAPDLDPIPVVTGDELYAVDAGAVKRVTTTSESPTLTKVSGTLGGGGFPIDALAVSGASSDIVLRTDDRTTLRRAPLEPGEPTRAGEPTTLLSSVSNLLRPQFTRYGEIWDVGSEGGRQRIWVFTADGKDFKIDPPVPPNRGVTAFKISPDGTRMAMVHGSQLGVARIIRSSDRILVNDWRPLDTTQIVGPQIGMIRDVAWLNATELLVLGAANANTAFAPFRVAMDASRISAYGDPPSWDAHELAVLPRTQSAVVVGRVDEGNRTWKYDGNQWLLFVENVSTIAYPG
ncbi:MAG TPA: LpqB family beta-propeller domain-containing protein [Propionibacteriaceae bacterium]|nr:LpqB family beta-propeller domain-containing protein [Propionibacteriaceae bacterium]